VADAGSELASYFAADTQRKGTTTVLAAVRDAALMDSVL
jgi:hypothetical protein